jgi:hypothetical protein
VKARAGAAAVALVMGGASLAPAGARSESPLDLARDAAEQTAFSGVVDVVWRDGAVRRHQQLSVKAARGVLFLGGPTPLMALRQTRLVRHKAAWSVLWPAAFGRLEQPDRADKYDEHISVGPVLLGRPTWEIDILVGDRVRERLFTDQGSDLLLRRQQYDDRGRLQRTIGFRQLEVGGRAPRVPAPHGAKRADARHSVEPSELHQPYSAPAALGGGYQRTGAFRQDDVVQVVYSDGIYDLSIFEQRGRLGSEAVPGGGRRVRVRDAWGWHYTWAGGQIVVWQAGRTVYTAVGDGPFDDVARAIRVLRPSGGPSLVQRFRRACLALVGGLMDD